MPPIAAGVARLLIRGLKPTSLARVIANRSAKPNPDAPVRVFYAVCDHYEPMGYGADEATQRNRVRKWTEGLPALMEPFRDFRGRQPQHTFFYPEEEYRREYLDDIGELCRRGLGEVEVHLHHDNDTSENLRSSLLAFTKLLHREHGFLHTGADAGGEPRYGFIHGNWCLDNSRPDGRYCGVNDEIDILRETGCYADFTLPAAPSPAQTTTVNSIYYAVDDPLRPKSHDRGTAAAVGKTPWSGGTSASRRHRR